MSGGTETARGAASPMGARSPLAAGLDVIDATAAKAIIAIMGVMVAVVSAQVFLRYGFNSSIDWADEVSRLCFVWSIFLAIPLGIKRGAHIGIELLVAHLPPRPRDLLYRATTALSAVLMMVVAYEAIWLTLEQWDEPMSTLDISVGWFMVPICVGAVHGLLHLIRLVLTGAPVKMTVVTE